jgi:DNA (cytosine-5)-methyltransferase 1
MKLLDLFCCQGGASHGYALAGFEVTGVDLSPQKHYPYEFIQADALAYLAEHGHEYDAIVASPPCQAWSEATPVEIRATLPKLIAPTRAILKLLGKPYIIENVENARHDLIDPVMLCGTMFGLPVWRHRYFEASFPVFPPSASCDHSARPVTIHSGSHTRKKYGNTGAAAMREALGCPWMTTKGLHECIPPAYTKFLGEQLMAHIWLSRGITS